MHATQSLPTDTSHAIPGRTIDLIRDGLRSPITRRRVASAVISVMLSAQRAGVPYSDVWSLLTDEHRSILAKQISTSSRGRQITPRKRHEFLKGLWEDAGRIIAEGDQDWSAGAALTRVRAHYQEHGGRQLTAKQEVVFGILLEIGEENGTTEPNGPAREVARRAGWLYPGGKLKGEPNAMLAHRTLMQLCASNWLAIAERGKAGENSGKANSYKLLPAISSPRVGGLGYRPPGPARPRAPVVPLRAPDVTPTGFYTGVTSPTQEYHHTGVTSSDPQQDRLPEPEEKVPDTRGVTIRPEPPHMVTSPPAPTQESHRPPPNECSHQVIHACVMQEACPVCIYEHRKRGLPWPCVE